jgi:DNA-binding SARP family transcriptional activator
MYEIQLFGPLEVRTRGVRLSGDDLGGDLPRHILALLALRGKVRKAELAELLWPGRPPAGHLTTMEGQLSLLCRRLDPGAGLGDSLLTVSDGGYALVADRVRVDVARFDELVAAASGRPTRGALRALTAAAHLAGRPLLEDVTGPSWVTQARAHYRDRLAAILVQAGELALTSGDPRTALETARRTLGTGRETSRARVIMRSAEQALREARHALSVRAPEFAA